MSFTIGPPGLEKPAFQRISNSHFKSRSLNVLLGRMLDLLKTETMVSKNPATSAFGLGSLVFRDHRLGFKKVYPRHKIDSIGFGKDIIMSLLLADQVS